MPSTLEFLKAILPVDGWKCAAIFKNGKPHHEWTEDLAKLELILLSADEQGATAYHGCAAYRTRGSRVGANASACRALWLDIDAGPHHETGKPRSSYPDATAAWRATEAFRKSVDFPAPLYVSSGAYSLHVYWPLSADVSPEIWLAHAKGLKALAKQQGLEAGAERTADIASILRPPGTHNRKGGTPVLVECGDIPPSYPIDAFASLRGSVGARPAVNGAGRSTPGPASLSGTLAASLKEAFERKSYVDGIVRSCQQINRVSSSVGHGSRLAEPIWHAAIGVLAYAIGGDAAAREYAKGYDGHSEAETSAWVQAKLDRARVETTGPTTCQRFFDLDPAGCAGCPFAGRITSPIVLGYRDEQRRSEPVSSDSADLGAADSGRCVIPDRWLPQGFAWSTTGQLTFVSETGKGIASAVVISEYPLYLESIGTSEAETDTFSYNFRLELPLGVRTISMPARQFMGPDGISYMFSRGAVIHERDHFRKYVMSAVDQFNRATTPVTRYEQFGWKDGETAFLWGRSLYTGNNVLPAAAVDEVATRGKLLNPKLGGSLDRWTAAANRLFARDCEPHAFALLCSFAAPLMRFHSTDEGGAILCLVGPPGTGKTTALDAAGSVWGQHRALDLNTFDTRASRGVNLGVLGNLPVLYDELEKQDSDVLREFVTIFTAGRDRARATVDGGIRHEARTWQTIVIAAANRSVVELVARQDDNDALASRILEFPGHLPAGMSDREGTDLRNEMKMNCGFAADLYIRYLVQPEVTKWIREMLKAKTDEVWARTGLKSEHRFWVRTIGSVWVASLLVEKAGLLAFSPQRLIDWAIAQVTPAVVVEPHVYAQQRALSTLAEYLYAHVGEMVRVPGPFRAGVKSVTPQTQFLRKISIRCENEPRRFLVAEKPFKEWLLKKDIPAAQCLKDLWEAGVAARKSRLVTLTAGTDIPGGQVLCVEVNGQHPALSGVLAPIEALEMATMEKRA